MSVVYSKLLSTSLKKILGDLEALEHLWTSNEGFSEENQATSQNLIQRIKHLGGFFGLQSVSDIFSWMEEVFLAGQSERDLLVRGKDILIQALNRTRDILSTVDEPSEYGEFVKSSGVALRPLYTRTIPIKDLFDSFKSLFPVSLSKRCIYQLPVALGEEFAYSLKVPSRFLEENRTYPGYLSLVFLDLGRQDGLPWERTLEDFQFWTRQGAFIYQGALELPYERLHRKTSILPYYVLLRSINHPEDFLAVNHFHGHPMKILKTPEEEITFFPPEVQEGALDEEGDTEDFSPEDLVLPRPRAILESEESQEVAEELFSPFEPIYDDKDFYEPHSFPEEYHEDLAQELGLPPQSLAPGPRKPEVSKPVKTLIPLSSIPFTVRDLENPQFSWPQGPHSLNLQDLLNPVDTPKPAESPEVETWDLGLTEAEALKKKIRAPETTKPAKKKRKGLSISFKMIGIISLVIVTSLSGMIALATTAFFSDTTVRIEENYQKISEVVATSLAKNLRAQADKSRVFLDFMARTPEDQKKSRMESFFSSEDQVLLAGVLGPTGELQESYRQEAVFMEKKITPEKLGALVLGEKDRLDRSQSRDFLLTNGTYYLGLPTLALSRPMEREGKLVSLLVILDTEKAFMDLVKMAGISTTMVLNERGELLVHPDLTELANSKQYAGFDFIKKIAENKKLTNNKIEYKAPVTGLSTLGFYRKVDEDGLTVLTSVDQTKAFEAANQVLFRNLLLLALAVSFSMFVILLFSKTITTPIQALVGASRRIQSGDFAIKLKPRVRDELGILNESFEEMSQGLADREKLKDAFGKFVNKEIAELVSKGEVKLGGERKTATIFFSDIRSFTAISEKLQPEEVVEFLNQYMTRMVSIVNRTHGNVDKFIGDAIMAVWGTPISYGNDAENAVNAALQMRLSLLEFNQDRGDEKHPVIKIGCGINTGAVLAGQIGSDERMEYTVIGDAVNLASRIEALNKPMGTDILISQDTYEVVKNLFNVVPMQPIKVKGKSEPQQIFCVLGRKDDLQAPRTLEDLRRILKIEGDFGTVDLDKEEVKYEILPEKTSGASAK